MPGTDMVVHVGQAVGLVTADDLDDAARDYAAAAKPTETQRAYNSDWRHFCRWCAEQGASPLPAFDTTMTRYFAGLARFGRTVSTEGWRHARVSR